MKLLFLTILAILAVFASADIWDPIDWSNVAPIHERAGFWNKKSPLLRAKFPENGNKRVVGGEIATAHQFPYQVALLISFPDGTYLCGGSIISNTVILTAAHCPYESTATLVILGAYDRSIANEATQHRISVTSAAYRIHRDYDEWNIEQDIATIIVPSFTFTPAIQPIVLAVGTELFVGETAVVSGFGLYQDNGYTSNVVRFVALPVISNALCELSYGPLLPSHLCTSGSGGRSSCGGDSGGPLTIQRSGASYQIGIVSFGASAGCELEFPAAFTRVNYFDLWIRANSH